MFIYSKSNEFPLPGSWQLPLLPDTHSYPSAQPSVPFSHSVLHVCYSVVVKPPSLSHNNGYSFRSVPHRPPRVPYISFPPSICRIYCTWFRAAIGLHPGLQTHPHARPFMRFLFVRPEVCPWVSRFHTSGFLQIPPHDEPPCLRLTPSHYRADPGLSPVRNVRRRAYWQTRAGSSRSALFYAKKYALYIWKYILFLKHRGSSISIFALSVSYFFRNFILFQKKEIFFLFFSILIEKQIKTKIKI